MSDDLTTVWCAMQELGAALNAMPESADQPEWLQRLRSAVDDAQDAFDEAVDALDVE